MFRLTLSLGRVKRASKRGWNRSLHSSDRTIHSASLHHCAFHWLWRPGAAPHWADWYVLCSPSATRDSQSSEQSTQIQEGIKGARSRSIPQRWFWSEHLKLVMWYEWACQIWDIHAAVNSLHSEWMRIAVIPLVYKGIQYAVIFLFRP